MPEPDPFVLVETIRHPSTLDVVYENCPRCGADFPDGPLTIGQERTCERGCTHRFTRPKP